MGGILFVFPITAVWCRKSLVVCRFLTTDMM